MPHRDTGMRIRDILDAVHKVVDHTKDLDFDAFTSDEWTIDAVLRNLTVIGEATRHISADVIAAHPDVAWAEMRDMRNIVVHEYFGVDLQIIWTTVRDDLPSLIQPLEAILADPSRKESNDSR